MIRLIAQRELLDHLLSLRFHLSMLALAMLLGLSVYVMGRDYDLRSENYAVNRERARPRAGEADTMAVVSPQPLAVFAKGLDESMTRGYTITSYMGIMPFPRQAPAFGLLRVFPAPDLLYVVKAVLSLIALLFAYDAVAGERENGTLKLVLASAVSRGEMIAGKLLGGLAAVLLPFLLVVAGATLAVALRPTISFTGEDYARLGLMLVAALLYVSLFFSVGVLVSTLLRTSAEALVVLLFFWAAVVFAVPNLGNLVAERLAPPPSTETHEALRRQEFAKNRFLEIQSHDSKARATWLGEFNRAYDRLVEDYTSRLDRTTGLSQSLSRISPAGALANIFTGLAGTGVADERRLTRSLMDFKSRNLAALDRSSGRSGLPVFEFTRAPLSDTLAGGVLFDLALLAVGCAATAAVASVAFLRSDPR